METAKINKCDLKLPKEISDWIAGAEISEFSGESGAKTFFIDKEEGAFLKIFHLNSLGRLFVMQNFFNEKGLSSKVIMKASSDRDYIIIAGVNGEDGVSEKHLAQPERLSRLFGKSLRRLHDTDASGCILNERNAELVSESQSSGFRQNHLDLIESFIGKAEGADAAREIYENRHLLKSDALIHGDYCLPNIIVNDWAFSGFIDVADGGIGDRHYDIAWGIWTLCWNLKSPHYAEIFLDAYGRELIDKQRLRICGLLAAMDV